MGLKRYDLNNMPVGINTTPLLCINFTDGKFSFNSHLLGLLGIADGDTIGFVNDDEEPADWYIFKGGDSDFPVKPQNDSKSMIFRSLALCRKIADTIGWDRRSGQIRVSLESKEFDGFETPLFPLITKGIRQLKHSKG